MLDLLIAESQYSETSACKYCIAFLIGYPLTFVNFAINFYD